ncbi:MAG: hypothetical protein WBZ36_02980 [Candidatus Nitrosopolaris sp.]
MHKPSRAVLSVKDVRQSMVYERDKIMMSGQSKNCLVDQSWGSTRRHGADYYITTLIPFIKCWTSLLYLPYVGRPTGNQVGREFLNHMNEKLENIRDALKRKENGCHSVLMI